MSAPFQPGDLVVCVDDTIRVGLQYTRTVSVWRPRKGGFYRIVDCDEFAFCGGYYVDLVEDPTPLTDAAWEADRFRKIDDEVTPEFIELLRKLPVRAPEKVA